MSKIKQYSPEYYSEISSWWKIRGWPVAPEDALPKTGFIIPGICAGFLYKTDSSVALLEWIISNPASNKDERNKALDAVIEHLIVSAKQEGFKILFSSLEHPKLIERYKKHEFKIADTTMTNLVRIL